MTITKAELSQTLSDTLGLNKRESKEIVEDFFGQIGEILQTGEDVKLSGFGNFELRDKSPRPGRNPRTGEDVPITARRVVTFKPGQKLRALVDQHQGV
jgi:integration host factor subunit alpha